MFFVTLGFQFLATFSGKAFLMAKMALLLASINGLKRVRRKRLIENFRSMSLVSYFSCRWHQVEFITGKFHFLSRVASIFHAQFLLTI
jgi:hypothetical protein